MIDTPLKDSIISAVFKYITDEIAGKYYKYRDTEKYCAIYNLTRQSARFHYHTRDDISLSQYNVLCDIVEYNEEFPQYTGYHKRFMSMTELYSTGWKECRHEEYVNAYKKVEKYLNNTYDNTNESTD